MAFGQYDSAIDSHANEKGAPAGAPLAVVFDRYGQVFATVTLKVCVCKPSKTFT